MAWFRITQSSDLPSRLLREELQRDARSREASVVNAVVVVGAMLALVSVGLSPISGWALGAKLLALCLAYLAWYVPILLLLRRGWFRPWLPWVNVCLEVTAPAVAMGLDVAYQGPLFALASPLGILWAVLVMAAALRSSPGLAVLAGVVAAAELLAVYFVLVLPRMEDPAPALTFTMPYILLRAFFLLAAGAVGGMMAGHLVRRAERAMRAVRERELLGKYLLHERVGAGGMAEVFRATYCPEGGFEKEVAIKRVLPAYAQDSEFMTLFRREAELGSWLNHQNIVQVFDVGRFGDSYFLAMEYVSGLSLKSLLRRITTPLPLSAVSYLASELAAALDYVHRRRSPAGEALNLVHRDVNPPNILLSRYGEVKLADFGIARAASHVQLTVGGKIRGKVGYMAPEQAVGEPLDGRADLFALGLTLHEALTGRPAIQGDTERGLLLATTRRRLEPPSARRRDVPPELDALVMALLEKTPERRTGSAGKLGMELGALPRTAASFPDGQRLLAEAVQESMELPERGLSEPTTEAATAAV